MNQKSEVKTVTCVLCENVAKNMEWNLEKWSGGVELKEENIWDWIPSKNKYERERERERELVAVT